MDFDVHKQKHLLFIYSKIQKETILCWKGKMFIKYFERFKEILNHKLCELQTFFPF